MPDESWHVVGDPLERAFGDRAVVRHPGVELPLLVGERPPALVGLRDRLLDVREGAAEGDGEPLGRLGERQRLRAGESVAASVI